MLYPEEAHTLKFNWPDKLVGKVKINYELQTKANNLNRVYSFDTMATFNISKENNIYKVMFNDIQVKHKKISPQINDKINLLLDIDSNYLDFCLNDKGEIIKLLNYSDYKQNVLNQINRNNIKAKYSNDLLNELKTEIDASDYESKLLLNLQKEWEYLLQFWFNRTLREYYYYTIENFMYVMPSISANAISGINQFFIQSVNKKNRTTVLKNIQYIPANTLYKILREKYNISYINFWMHKYRVRTTYYLETNIDTLVPKQYVVETSIRLPGVKKDDIITYTFD
ncbi:hypothetical protein NO1_1141 [Candidatus Termititenax aidoneus]|uniref:Uncharacterized protein n=1 Tax=Termititenax aidoneus TaxID=2218524 RepID=A0A388TBW1_TERA1|nr:hypothetical protein NO1_1141 [Candidatus Termititenax aidoneus]